jgi:hypothetical protein
MRDRSDIPVIFDIRHRSFPVSLVWRFRGSRSGLKFTHIIGSAATSVRVRVNDMAGYLVSLRRHFAKSWRNMRSANCSTSLVAMVNADTVI